MTTAQHKTPAEDQPEPADAVRELTRRLEDTQLVFRALADAANEPILAARADGRHVYVNGAAAGMTGYSVVQLLAMKSIDLVAPRDRARFRAVTRARLAGRPEPEPYEITIRTRGGTEIPVEIVGSRVAWDGEVVTVGMVRNIAARRTVEREVLDMCANETYRIGRDLHDTLGQDLFGLRCLTGRLCKRLAAEAPDLQEETARLHAAIGDAMQHSRRIARGLLPVDRAPEGLALALRNLAGVTREMMGAACDCRIEEGACVYDHRVATHLYHIAQEAVNNAVRHGGATRVTLLLRTGRRPRLEVRNNGRPLPEAEALHEGLGLRIMRFRARMCGGTLRLRSGANTETAVVVRFEDPAAQRE
jgi:two-component system, LuxR family, sensor kinase FixL